MENSEYEVLIANEIGEIDNEEIERGILLLEEESSNPTVILSDLNKLLKNDIKNKDTIKETLLMSGFLSSAAKIFEKEKEGDENILNLLVSIINRLAFGPSFKQKRKALEAKDAITPLYQLFISDFPDIEINEELLKVIITISKKHPSDVINNDKIKTIYSIILPSNEKYSVEKKKNIFCLFKKMIKEELIKKEEVLSEIIEEMMFIEEEMKNKKNIINFNEELMKEAEDFMIIAKEKGFKEENAKDKNLILSDFLISFWKEVCSKKNADNSDNSTEKITEEEENKDIQNCLIMKVILIIIIIIIIIIVFKYLNILNMIMFIFFSVCNYLFSTSYDIQMEFMKKLYHIIAFELKPSSLYNCFVSRENGIFLKLYFPFFFKIYHFEEVFPKLFNHIRIYCRNINIFYEHIIKLSEDMMERIKKELEEKKEINEEICVIIMFLWSVFMKEGWKEKDLEFLIGSTSEVFEWLGRIEEEKESLKEGNNEKEGMKESVNVKEFITFNLLYLISSGLSYCSGKDEEKIKEDGRIGKELLEIVKNHLKNEGDIIKEGNKKRIIEYVIFSYYEDIDTSDLLSLSSPSFPFSLHIIVYILSVLKPFLPSNDYMEIEKNEMIRYIIEVLNNYYDTVKIIDESDVKKEIEKEIKIEWNDNILNTLKKKSSFSWVIVNHFLLSYLNTIDVSVFDNENNNIMKRLTYIHFNHSNRISRSITNDNEKKNDSLKENIVMRPFITDTKTRSSYIYSFVCYLFNGLDYSDANIMYYVKKEENGLDIISIYLKGLSGEIVDRIKKREGNNSNNIIKERRRFERERTETIFEKMLNSLLCLQIYCKNIRECLSKRSEKDSHHNCMVNNEKEKQKEYISDVMEEEDSLQCFLLFFTNNSISQYYSNFSFGIPSLSNVNSLSYLLLHF